MGQVLDELLIYFAQAEERIQLVYITLWIEFKTSIGSMICQFQFA